MSWSMGFVVVRDCRSSDVLGCIQGACLTGESVAADDVFTSELPFGARLSLAEVDGWCIIVEPFGLLFIDVLDGHGDILSALSKGTAAMGFFLAGITGTCAFRLCIDGVERRWIMHEARQIVDERGTAILEELGIPMPAWGYDEDWVFTLLERLTGLTWSQLQAHRFALASAPALDPGALD